MQKVKRFDPIAVASVLLFVLIAYFTQAGMSGIASNLFTISFPLVLFAFIYKLFSRSISKGLLSIVTITAVLSCFNVLINGTNADADWSYDFVYYRKVIIFCTTLLWIVYCMFTSISRTTVWIEIALVIVLNITFIVFYRQGFSIEYGEALLTLNFSNPNLAGGVMVTALLYLLLPIFAGKDLGIKGRWRFICLAVLISLAVTVIGIFMLTGCRSAFGTLGLFLVLVLIDRIPRLNFKLKKWMIACIVVFPFIFSLLYVSNITLLDIDTSLGMTEVGKNNKTRIVVWLPIVSDFLHYMPIGDYSGISNGTGASQMHNTHLDIFASYGIVVLLLYLLLLYKAIVHVGENVRCRFQRLSLYAFVSCFVFMTFEAGFVSGSQGLFLLIGGFLMLANYQMPQKGIFK